MRMTIMAVMAMYAGCVFAQNPTDDPGGWGRTKWGMTKAEVSESLKGRTAIQSLPVATKEAQMEVPAYEIAKIAYRVSFYFDGSEHLIQVRLTPSEERLRNVAQGVLLRLLTDKYGAPREDSPKREGGTTGGTRYGWHWIFAKTIIDLDFVDYGLGTPGILFLSYHLREQNSDL